MPTAIVIIVKLTVRLVKKVDAQSFFDENTDPLLF